MNECLFCGIVSGEIEATVVAEGPEWVAFPDLHPKAPTHVLIIPKTHVGSLDDLSAEPELGSALLEACRTVAETCGVTGGYRVVTNVGQEGGQAIDHLHFHVLGGRQMGWPPG